MTFANKTVWVTGASSGIGEALAKGFAARGAAVIVSGRKLDELQRVAGLIGDAALALPFEATDFEGLPNAVDAAWRWKGAVDCLVNNAGVSQRSLAVDTGFSVYRSLMEVDFFAPVRLTQLVLPRMIERRSGQIAIVSSLAGKIGVTLRTGYCAAKHACVGYFDALRAEVEEAYGVSVSVILPGSVRTNISANALTANGGTFGRTDVNIQEGMTPEAAADRIIAGLAAKTREIAVADGMELAMLRLRTGDPESLFALMAQEGARLAALRAEAGVDFVPENQRFNTRP